MKNTGAVSLARLAKLISDGIGVDSIDELGRTPLHLAASTGDADIVKRFLAQGAKLQVLDRDGYAPIHAAVLAHRDGVVKLLLDAGADIECRTAAGRTSLHLAGLSRDESMIKFLLINGANVYAQDKEGRNCIDLVVVETAVNAWLIDYNRFVEGRYVPHTAKQVYHLLATWPLADPTAPIDRLSHLSQLFANARFQKTAAGKDVAMQIITDLKTDGLPFEHAEILRTVLNPVTRPKPQPLR